MQILIGIIAIIVYVGMLYINYLLLKNAKEEALNTREERERLFDLAIKATMSKDVGEYTDVSCVNKEKVEIKEPDEIVDMYDVDEEILIKKLTEENGSEQNQN